MNSFGTLILVGVGIILFCFATPTTPIQSAKFNTGRVFSNRGAVNETNESWAYVTVRPKAHMFYWLYHTTHKAGYLNRPLILWLQGGPGASGTGYGNFNELGPLDTDLKPRKTTWLQTANLLFVDNPVGAGYSYVDDKTAYTTNIAEIAADLLALMKGFISNHEEFQKVPFYIFSESYGGKMTAAFSDVLYEAISRGEVTMNFQGFAMGDSWISPVDSTNSWGPYLKATSIVSQNGLNILNKHAQKIEQYVKDGLYTKATLEWNNLEGAVEAVGSGVNFYNINEFDNEATLLKKRNNSSLSHLERLYNRHVKVMQEDELSEFMNGPIRKKLKIIPQNVKWGGQASMVFTKQAGDFMRDVVATVNKLVNAGKLKVVVYSGQLDLICDVLGTEAWFSKLDIAKAFSNVDKQQFSCTGKPVCYFGSSLKNVNFYWILGAGHMVPADNGPGALSMVNRIIDGK